MSKPSFSGEWCIVEAQHQGKPLTIPTTAAHQPFGYWTISSPNSNNPHATSAVNQPGVDYEFRVKIGNTLSAPVALRDCDPDQSRLARIRAGPCEGGTGQTVAPHLQAWEGFLQKCLNGALLVMELKPRKSRVTPGGETYDMWLQGSEGIKIVLRNRKDAEKEATKKQQKLQSRSTSNEESTIATTAEGMFGGEWRLVELYNPPKSLIPLPTSLSHPIVWNIQTNNENEWEFSVKVGNRLTTPVILHPPEGNNKTRLRRIQRMGPCDATLLTVAPEWQKLENVLQTCLEGGLLVMEVKEPTARETTTSTTTMWLQGPTFKVVLQR